MKVRGDKMNNYRGLQIGKPCLACCVPVLLRVSRRLEEEEEKQNKNKNAESMD